MALEQYDLARKRASQQAETDKQSQGDALKRRFAAMGNLNSGAYVKQQGAVDDQVAKRRDDVNEGINAAESGEVLRRKELQDNRDFSSNEAEKGRTFQSGESALQRAYGTSERLGSQDYSSGENALQRRFQTSEREGSQGFATGEREASQTYATGEREGSQQFAASESKLGRDLQSQQFDQTYKLQKQIAKWDQKFKNAGLTLERDKFKHDQDIDDFNKMLSYATFAEENGLSYSTTSPDGRTKTNRSFS